MENEVVKSGVEIALYSPIIIAVVEAVKQLVPARLYGIVTIVVALLAGVVLGFVSPLTVLEGVSSALVAVGAVTYKRAGK